LIDKKTVFILGAGASCAYGYPSGVFLRKHICLPAGFRARHIEYLKTTTIEQEAKDSLFKTIKTFISAFDDSHNDSIDLFMANNPKLAPTGKYIIALEIFTFELGSCFGERAEVEQEARRTPSPIISLPENILRSGLFKGGDWYSHLFNRILREFPKKNGLPDLSDHKISFITFNYDRSLEQFLYESLINTFTEVSPDKIVESLRHLKIVHVFGQITPLKWQNPDDYVDYKPKLNESLLQRAANNIRTIYEEQKNPELSIAHKLIEEAEQIFCLGFGYAKENVDIIELPESMGKYCPLYGTALGSEKKEVQDIKGMIVGRLSRAGDFKNPERIKIENMDCLKLLRNYL